MFNLQNISFGLQTFILGMMIVFLSLILIWLFVSLIGKAFTKSKNNEKKQEKTAPKKEVSPAPADTSSSAVVTVDNQADIIAAITAAISRYENKPLGSFRVVSFKKR